MAPDQYDPRLLAREHDALANMAGAEARRVDILIEDVGKIKGSMESVRGDVHKVAGSVDQLREGMIALNRHALLLESQQKINEVARKDADEMDARLRVVEVKLPALEEARSDYRRGILLVVGTVLAAVIALILKVPQ